MKLKSLQTETLTPHPCKIVLIQHGVKAWQLLRRFSSLGIRISEPKLSRILNGRENASPEVEEVLRRIEEPEWPEEVPALSLERRVQRLEDKLL